jgi:hypothetical protein
MDFLSDDTNVRLMLNLHELVVALFPSNSATWQLIYCSSFFSGWARYNRSDYYEVRTSIVKTTTCFSKMVVFEDLTAVHFWRLFFLFAMLRAELIRIMRFILKLLRVQTLVNSLNSKARPSLQFGWRLRGLEPTSEDLLRV